MHSMAYRTAFDKHDVYEHTDNREFQTSPQS